MSSNNNNPIAGGNVNAAVVSMTAPPSFILRVDEATTLSTGTVSLPPMVSVPCHVEGHHASRPWLGFDDGTTTTPPTTSDGERRMRELIKPPNVDDLYQWYADVRSTPGSDPTWGVVWSTAVALTNHLLLHPETVVLGRRRRPSRRADSDDETTITTTSTTASPDHVVELGSGVALCGLAAAIELGASRVTVTDREPFALHCALASAACHPSLVRVGDGSGSGKGGSEGSEGKDEMGSEIPTLSAAILDWCQVEQSAPQLVDTATTILVSDVLYDGTTIDAFADACMKILKKKKDERGGASSSGVGDGMTADVVVIDADCIVLVADPKMERFAGAREKLLQSQLAKAAKMVDVIDLPMPSSSLISSELVATTLDGRDHVSRMQEPSVLIQFTF